MSLKYKIALNTLIQFIGRFFTSFLGFLTTVILARYLGVEQYGVYAKIYTLVSFFYLFIDFGLNAVYIRKFKDNLEQLGKVMVLRTVIFSLSLVLIVSFLVISGSQIYSVQEKLWVLLFVPTILFFGYFTTLNIVFQLKLRYDLSILAAVLGSLLGLISLILTIHWGIAYAILSLVFGYGLTTFFAYLLAKRFCQFRLNLSVANDYSLSSLFKEAIPLGAMLFLNTMYARADVLILSALKGNEAVGIYNLAYKFFEFPLAFATFFANALFPYYAKTYAQDRTKFWTVFKQATLILFLSSFIFMLGGLFIAPFLGLIKTDYLLSARPLQILVLAYPIFFLTSAFSWLIFIQGKEKQLIWIYGLSFILNVLANLALIPQYGYLAASWLTVGGELVVLILLLRLIIKKHSIRI